MGDTLRRIVARTMAQQFAEAVSHTMQTLTDLDPRATILSVDGVGAFDLISGNSMMQGLLHMEGGEKLLPFVRMFYNTPSSFLWKDEQGQCTSSPR